MKIIESLFIEQNDNLFAVLSEVLPLVPLSDAKLTTFRLEVDPELVLLLYRIHSGSNPSPEILDNIFPHLERIVLLASMEDVEQFQLPESVEQKLNEYPDSIPVIVVVGLNEKSGPELKKLFLEKGLYLGQKSRLYFWKLEQSSGSLRVWKNIWARID